MNKFYFKNERCKFCSIINYMLKCFSLESVHDEGSGKPHEEKKTWVVLVAGSNGWFNYRHQATSQLFLFSSKSIFFLP